MDLKIWRGLYPSCCRSPIASLVLSPACRSGESAPEPPTKKIKIEPTDMFKESDVSSLQHP